MEVIKLYKKKNIEASSDFCIGSLTLYLGPHHIGCSPWRWMEMDKHLMSQRQRSSCQSRSGQNLLFKQIIKESQFLVKKEGRGNPNKMVKRNYKLTSFHWKPKALKFYLTHSKTSTFLSTNILTAALQKNVHIDP